MDNTSNNDVAITKLKGNLAEKNIKFDAQEQQIQCYLHIINKCVSHIIKSLAEVDDKDLDDEELEVANGDEEGYTNEEDEEGGATDKAIISKYMEEDTLLNWFKAVKRDPVNIAHKLICTMRTSGQKWDCSR